MAKKRLHADITADDRDFRNKADRTAKKGNWLSGQFKKIGGAIAAAMAGAFAFTKIIQGLKTVIKNTADFEKSLASLSAITGATGDELKFYGKEARDMARETMFGASEIVEAFKLMGSARPELLKNKDALAAVTKEALILAEASGMDATEATLSLAKAMNQFNIPAEEAGRVINVLAAGSKFGAAEIPAVADAIKSMGTAANMANISLEQSVGMIEALAEKGLSGAESGTMLRNVILMLQKEADHLNPQIVGMSKALENLAAENLSSAEMTQMFGLRNQQAATILVENRHRIDELTTSVTGTTTAYEQQAAVTDTLHAQWKIFGDTLADLTIKGDGFTTSLKNLLKGTTDWMQSMQIAASSDTIKWWEKTAILFNNILPGGMKMTKEQVDALEKSREKSSSGLRELVELEEELLSIYDDGNKVVEEQIKTIGDYKKKIDELRESLQKLAPEDLEQIKLTNEKIDRYEELIKAATEYRGIVDDPPPPAPPLPTESVKEFTERLQRQTEAQKALRQAQLEAIDTLFGLDEAYQALDETVKNIDETWDRSFDKIEQGFTRLQESALAWGDAVIWAGVQGEGSLKDYARTVVEETKKAIAAYLAETVALAVRNAVGSGPWGIALAGLAGGTAAAAFNTAVNKYLPTFAEGGAVSGPTLALVGEGPGVSRSNPEYIGTAAQLGQMGQGGGGTAKFLRISRGDLLFAVSESQSHSERSF